MDYYDISPLISEDMAVFPGDTPYSRHTLLDFAKGDALTLSGMRATLHLGAHADAPNHYHAEGEDIASRNLDYYLGTCQVMSVPQKPAPYRLLVEDLAGQGLLAPRLLLKTNSFGDPNQWCDDFTALSPELIHLLAHEGIKTIGIDTPSVDPAASKELETHQVIYQHNMAILEGLVLNHVPDGVYQLLALPLKIKGADASPVRAVLLRVTK